MKKAERLQAEKYLLQCIFDQDPDFVDRTMEAFSVSRSTVYNYLTTLQKNGEIERVGGSMPYRILYDTRRFTVDTSRERSEDRMFARDIAPLIADLPANLQKIWRYAFTAMMNNALEHARASAVVVVVSRNRLCTIIGVLDNGVGIFRRIAQDVKEAGGELLTPAEAASLLYAGGYSGAPDTHAGEGIFFTSRLMDHFAIRSDYQLFTTDDDEEENGGERFRGTAVQMALANDSTRELSEVMGRYVDPELGFIRTELPLARFFGGDFPVSRSEARRLLSVLADFREAELDFGGIAEVGRDFAHELFTVAAGQGDAPKLTVKNASPTVEAALRRAGYNSNPFATL
ncbi:MAG: STAS-like domain-containing protein [Clostridia bacterium]|nr:STAS-like domain-containing protein [Clostridia bacterium]